MPEVPSGGCASDGLEKDDKARREGREVSRRRERAGVSLFRSLAAELRLITACKRNGVETALPP